MSDDEKSASGVVRWFGSKVAGLVDTKPRLASELLLRAFELKRFQTRHLPEAAKLPCGQAAERISLEGVTGAFEEAKDAVITSIFTPTEPFLALGLKPLVAEALADFTSGARAEEGFVRAAEAKGIPETYCSYHKVLLGYAAAGALEPPRLVASCSVACDANSLTFRELSRELGCPQVYVDVPSRYDEEACRYVASQLREMAREAEEACGRALDEERLREHVARSQASLDALVRSLPLRHDRYLHNSMVVEMYEALDLNLSLGSEDTAAMMRQMLNDYASAEPFDGTSLVWMHTAPFFSAPLQRMLDVNTRAQIVGSDMVFCQASFEGWEKDDATGLWQRAAGARPWAHDASEPWEAMAERLIKNAFNGPARRRIELARTLVEQTQADGVVCFCHWGCKQTMGMAQLARRELEAAGIPVLVLDGDGCHQANNADGQAATRMGAFLEMLEARR